MKWLQENAFAPAKDRQDIDILFKLLLTSLYSD